MKNVSTTYSPFILLFTLLLNIFITESAIADKTVGELKVPFGIRNYDTGAAQNFTLNDIDGEAFEFKSTRGHWVFLHFWASWCGPCKEEMPMIQKMADQLQGKKFQIVMINTAEDEDTVFEFLSTIDVELNSLLDTDGLVTEIWKPRGLPTTFLIAPDGKVKYQAIGGRDWHKPEYIDFLKVLMSTATTR